MRVTHHGSIGARIRARSGSTRGNGNVTMRTRRAASPPHRCVTYAACAYSPARKRSSITRALDNRCAHCALEHIAISHHRSYFFSRYRASAQHDLRIAHAAHGGVIVASWRAGTPRRASRHHSTSYMTSMKGGKPLLSAKISAAAKSNQER